MSILMSILKPLFFVSAVIFIVVDIVLVVGIILTVQKIKSLKPDFGSVPKADFKTPLLKDEKFKKRWEAVLIKAYSAPPNSYVLAIIEADKIMDDILERLGLKGVHTADRLEALASWDLKSIDELWRVHRIRNELVHTPGFNLSLDEAREVLGGYEKFFKEVGVI
ncbi:MAG: hypothetical protein QMD50_00820 [Patescibacteria group bacterium]|nr:hypothetical protein [Patescibacteria group bacterium]